MEYILTPEADEDLISIWNYTETEWGERQAVTYLGQLEECFHVIATGHVVTKPSPSGDEGLYYHRCQHHYIFFVKEEPLQIIRIFHERMDMIERLKAHFGL